MRLNLFSKYFCRSQKINCIMNDVRCYFLRADIEANKNINMSSFKSSEKNIQKNEDGPDRYVTNNQFSSAALNEMSLVVRKQVFGVSDQVPHKLGCTAEEDG